MRLRILVLVENKKRVYIFCPACSFLTWLSYWFSNPSCMTLYKWGASHCRISSNSISLLNNVYYNWVQLGYQSNNLFARLYMQVRSNIRQMYWIRRYQCYIIRIREWRNSWIKFVPVLDLKSTLKNFKDDVSALLNANTGSQDIKRKEKKTIKTDPETRIAHEKSVVPRVQQSLCITNAIPVQPKY